MKGKVFVSVLLGLMLLCLANAAISETEKPITINVARGQTGKVKKIKRLILEGIMPSDSGSASRVVVTESANETYPYDVKDSGFATCRFNGTGRASWGAESDDTVSIMREFRGVNRLGPACIFGAICRGEKGVEIPVSRDDDGMAYFDLAPLVAKGDATVVGQDGENVSLAGGTIMRTFKGNQEIPVSKDDKGRYYFDLPKLVHNGGATVVGQNRKSISLADGGILLTFEGEQEIPVSQDKKGSYYFDFPQLVAKEGAIAIASDQNSSLIPVSKNREGNYYFDLSQLVRNRGEITVSQKRRCKNTDLDANYELYGRYTMSEGEGRMLKMIGRGFVMYVKRLENVEKESFAIMTPALWTEGSEHIVIGKAEFFGYQVMSDRAYPLVFKMVKDLGYAYLCGRGTVTTKDGKTYRLGYEDTVDTWLPLLKSNDRFDREGAAQALGWLAKTKEEKDKAVPALIEALTDKVMEVRRNVAEALGRIGDPRAIEALNHALKEDKKDWVREVAEESIGLIEVKEAAEKLADGDKMAIAELTKGLKHKWVLVRRTTLELLVKGSAEAVEPLMTALKDEDAEVRTNAAKVLGEIGDKSAIEPLKEALAKEQDFETKKAMEEAIGKLEKFE